MSVIFTSKDISKKLKIGKSRVREISKELEKKDYQFTKNQNTRIYNQKDFELFQIIVNEYQVNEDLPQSVQLALNNQSLSEVNLEEKLTNVDEIPVKIDVIMTNNTPLTPLENNIHKNLDMINEEKKDSFVNPETTGSENVNHSFLNEEQLEKSRPLIAAIQEYSVEESSAQEAIDPISAYVSVQETTLEEFIEPSFTITIEPTEASIQQQETINEVLVEHLTEEPHISENETILHSLQSNEKFENDDHQAIRFEEMTVEQVLDENNKLPDEVVINEANLMIENRAIKENVTTYVPTNTNQIMFEEFMSQITNLANQNEQILTQNQTLIKQNLEKDQKLEKILNSVEEKSEELQGLATVIEEKDEKLEHMFNEIQSKESSRDAHLMRMIRELQETKKMVAASKERDWKNAIKSLFFKPKSVK